MGVDYSGHYGLGFQVTLPEFEENHEFYENPIEFLDSICKNTEFSFFEVGEGSYTGNENDYFIIIDNPFANGLDVTEPANRLKKFLNEHNIGFEGEIDTVGGLEIW